VGVRARREAGGAAAGTGAAHIAADGLASEELGHRAALGTAHARALRAHRSGGQRRYSPDALDRVLLIRFAGEMGFSLPEIKLFLSGLRDNAPVGPRWKKLASRKLSEVEASIARSLRLKTLLQSLQHCRCASLKQCISALGLSENLRFVASRSR
jgi:DNA-binding transcriptional MerR regulator